MHLKKILIGSSALLAGTFLYYKFRKTIPSGINAVKSFDANKYLGKWFEIARFNFMFEKNLDYATAEYSLNKDGSIKVVNRGFDYKKLKAVEAKGKAIFAGNPDEAMLKVSFYGPFYAGYNVIAIDDKYKYALVAGRSRKYLWLLSKEKEMPKEILKNYLNMAEKLGFDTSKLVWTSH